MKKNLLFLLLAAATVITSCSKDDDDNNGGGGTTPVTNTSKLCNKNWKIVSATAGGIDITNQAFGPCDLDSYYRFSTNGTYLYDEGPTKCDTADPQTDSGTWSWAANETKLVLDNSDTTEVITNSGTSLKLGFVIQPGDTLVITFGL